MYKVFKSKGKKNNKIIDGWRIYSISPRLQRTIDGNPFYPSRQNAYARSKKLNDQGDPMDKIATFRVSCDYDYIPAFKLNCQELLEKTIHRHALFLVLDPDFSITGGLGCAPSEREVIFCIDTTAEDPSNDPLREDWMPTRDEVTQAQLDELQTTLRSLNGVTEVRYKFDDIKIC